MPKMELVNFLLVNMIWSNFELTKPVIFEIYNMSIFLLK